MSSYLAAVSMWHFADTGASCVPATRRILSITLSTISLPMV
jgi:hypothetical protein